MASTTRERVAAYRARRRAESLCIEAGCPELSGEYARCQGHRELAAERQRDRHWVSIEEHQGALKAAEDSKRAAVARLEREIGRLTRELQDERSRANAAHRAMLNAMGYQHIDGRLMLPEVRA